jgi:hypothetical protein
MPLFDLTTLPFEPYLHKNHMSLAPSSLENQNGTRIFEHCFEKKESPILIKRGTPCMQIKKKKKKVGISNWPVGKTERPKRMVPEKRGGL